MQTTPAIIIRIMNYHSELSEIFYPRMRENILTLVLNYI